MVAIPPKLLTAEDFIAQYGDNPRYELIDGELRNLEPTGPHEDVAGTLAIIIGAEIRRLSFNWAIPKSCLIQTLAANATVLRPDVIALDRDALQNEPLWQREPMITSGQAIRFVAEVVSTNWQDDYARKAEEYFLLRIPEYWIIDFRALGGLAFIGNPKQPTITVCTLQTTGYSQQQFRMNDAIVSAVFPELQLALQDLI
ncbi:MAG: Uma2 family endonuclease [Cyanobacteria bacterium P01_H01_bin.121]